MDIPNIFGGSLALNILFAAGYLWSIIWKGLGLWRSAHAKQQYWFIAILILNTVGILEIIYLFRFAKKKMTVKELASYIKRP